MMQQMFVKHIMWMVRLMLNTYFMFGDYLCRIDRYDRETGLWGYCCDEIPVLNGWACEKFIEMNKIYS